MQAFSIFGGVTPGLPRRGTRRDTRLYTLRPIPGHGAPLPPGPGRVLRRHPARPEAMPLPKRTGPPTGRRGGRDYHTEGVGNGAALGPAGARRGVRDGP
jgi:hypothetical protein